MATWYIASTTASPAGNDANAGTSSALPKATLAAVHTAAASGDTIIVKASTGSIVGASQTFTKSLTIQGESVPAYTSGAWTGAILDGAAATIQWATSGTITVTVSNLIYRNAVCGATSAFFSNGTSGSAFSFTKCIFHTLTIQSSLQQGGIYRPSVSGGTIAFNTCLFYGNTYPSDSIFNVFSNSITATLSNTIVYGATNLFGNRSGTASNHAATIQNCIFANTSSNAFQTFGTYSGTYAYNTTYNYTGVPSGTGNLTGDPLFIAPASGDMRLRPSSPAINVGVAL